jgi:hypothetical protein
VSIEPIRRGARWLRLGAFRIDGLVGAWVAGKRMCAAGSGAITQGESVAMSELLELLHGIEPVPDQVDRCVDEAFNAFVVPSAVLLRWNDYVSCVAYFHSHVERAILGLPPSTTADVEFSFGLCSALLRKRYGDGAPQTPFELARTGNEGGLRAVLKTIAELLSQQHASNRIGAAVSMYWSRQSPVGLLDAGREYVRSYGHLWPTELTECSAARLLGNFQKVLREHTFMMRRFRHVGR